MYLHNSRAFGASFFFIIPVFLLFIVLVCAFIAFSVAATVPLASTSSHSITWFASKQSERNEISVEEMKPRGSAVRLRHRASRGNSCRSQR